MLKITGSDYLKKGKKNEIKELYLPASQADAEELN